MCTKQVCNVGVIAFPVMTVLVRMRVELDDTPGCLAKVATVIGHYGGNITGVDVQSGWEDRVVDELTVEFADTVDILEVRRQIAKSAGAVVISHQTASRVDLLVKTMRELSESLADPPEHGLERLRRGLAALCGTPAAWIASADVAAASEVGRQAVASPGAAFVGRGRPGLPRYGDTIAGESSLLAIAIDPSPSGPVMLIARSVAQSFTTTEAERVEALVEFHVRLRQRLTPAPEGVTR